MRKIQDLTPVVVLYRRLLEAWNERHADEFAALFTADGSNVGFDGSPLNGRDENASAVNEIFKGHQTATCVAKVREVRDLAPDVALLRAAVGMVPPGKSEVNPAVNAIQSLVVVGHGDDRRIALLHNTPAAFVPIDSRRRDVDRGGHALIKNDFRKVRDDAAGVVDVILGACS